MKLYLILFIFKFLSSSLAQILPKLTIDEFLNSTYYSSLSLSPNGQYLLVHSMRPAWELNRYDNTLWLYKTQGGQKKLITNQLSRSITPKWSPSGNWIAFFEETVMIDIASEIPLAITWADGDSSLYYVSISLSKEENNSSESEWKDVIRYRQRKLTDSSTIYRIDISRKKRKVSVKKITIVDIDFLTAELLFVPVENKLVFTSLSTIVENKDAFEIYSIDLRNVSLLSRLTNNQALERNLQLSIDGKHVFFIVDSSILSEDKNVNTQNRLYSINLINGKIERWGKDFGGSIRGYTIRSQGGVYMLGQLGINVEIYLQQSSSKYSILQRGWTGTYHQISSSLSTESSAIALVYSSVERPEEVYFVNHIDQLCLAKAITSENQLLTQRNLPRAKSYKWINNEDDRTIEGVLHYPSGKFESATQGWLVLEPNYRGSTGYGDAFINELRFQLLSRPGRDILAGVDRLIADGIADLNKLDVGGYSYGGYLTNWLITQTTRFNAALSGAGPTEHISFWGRTDLPASLVDLMGGFPWEVPEILYNESIIYKLGKVQTPTHIITGTRDIRVPFDQSFILERSLHYMNVPVKLLLIPNEGHSIDINPWHGKIKVREEMKWLEKYGQIPINRATEKTSIK
ncbi:unnamed protein product [Rotaria sp. Silwood1]|nr:unnamed protein product [Rotaria sp. Silwood1]CAF3534908.1 unnamed protein product [Rotaria sp. Silwood1]CAF4572383.1 unnamed protein product [Rotaria sp. Silwood1]